MSAQSLQLLHSLALGFAVSGLLVSLYRLLAVPFLAFAAPAIIVRNTIRGRRIENRRFEFVFLATLIALMWSLMSGRVVTMVIGSFAF